jgi:hypothetical protein
LSVEDTLATYILFVRSRESGYGGLRSHVAALPTSYSSSIFFAKDELEVCAGTSLYTITKQLERRIEDVYKGLGVRVLGHYRDLFPLENSPSKMEVFYPCDRCCEPTTDAFYPFFLV